MVPQTICLSTEGIIVVRIGIWCSVWLASWLHPDEGIGIGITSGGGWTDSKTGFVDVAPVRPLWAYERFKERERKGHYFKTEAYDSIPASVDDGLVGESSSLESCSESTYKTLLILTLIGLAVYCGFKFSWVWRPSVPSSNIRCKATDVSRWSSSGVDLGKFRGTWLQVIIPAQRATMAGVKVPGVQVQCHTFVISMEGNLLHEVGEGS